MIEDNHVPHLVALICFIYLAFHFGGYDDDFIGLWLHLLGQLFRRISQWAVQIR
jgi:hypothetical protein